MDIDVYQDMDLLKRYAKEIVLYNKDGHFYLQSLGFFKRNVEEIDIAFPIVHGKNAEDGTLAGYLETIGIPLVGANTIGSALGQDKIVQKQVFEAMGLPIVDYTWFYDAEYQDHKITIFKDIKKMGYPVVVKPACLGSSVGINFVESEIDLDDAISAAMEYDNKVIIEKAVLNLKEVNCSVIGNYEYQETSVIEEVMSANELLTYEDKYLSNGKSKGMASTSRKIPADITSTLEKQIKKVSCLAFKALNLSGVCRIDFLIDTKTGDFYINEPNTIPGSLAFYLWEPTGKTYKELLDEVINIGIKNYKRDNQKTTSFETNILANFNGLKGSKGLKGLKGIKK
jgi:D-alanine-D-alanine ligase